MSILTNRENDHEILHHTAHRDPCVLCDLGNCLRVFLFTNDRALNGSDRDITSPPDRLGNSRRVRALR